MASKFLGKVSQRRQNGRPPSSAIEVNSRPWQKSSQNAKAEDNLGNLLESQIIPVLP